MDAPCGVAVPIPILLVTVRVVVLIVAALRDPEIYTFVAVKEFDTNTFPRTNVVDP